MIYEKVYLDTPVIDLVKKARKAFDKDLNLTVYVEGNNANITKESLLAIRYGADGNSVLVVKASSVEEPTVYYVKGNK